MWLHFVPIHRSIPCHVPGAYLLFHTPTHDQVGPAGVGKSQMTFGLALQAALPCSLGGAGGSVMLIDTEGKFSAPRLLEMARARHPVELGAWSELEPVLTRVLVMTPHTADDLMKVLGPPCMVAVMGRVLIGILCM